MIDPPAPGAWNMAVDEALLMDAAANGIATLRFYQWDAPTLSLGYFQKYDERLQHPASRHSPCVRRQTGGGAILHDRELTYSLTLPASHPLARRHERLYSMVHDAFIESLTALLADKLGDRVLRRRDQESSSSARDEPFLCFQRSAPGDVVLTYLGKGDQSVSKIPPFERKILGSAQRRHRGAVLQHGSLLLKSSWAAPEVAGLADLVGQKLAPKDVSEAVPSRIAAILHVPTSPTALSPAVQLNARVLTNTKYAAESWTKRR
jgi:lipoate-protein ligase A